MNIIEFFVNTYEEDIGKQWKHTKYATNIMGEAYDDGLGVTNSDEPQQ